MNDADVVVMAKPALERRRSSTKARAIITTLILASVVATSSPAEAVPTNIIVDVGAARSPILSGELASFTMTYSCIGGTGCDHPTITFPRPQFPYLLSGTNVVGVACGSTSSSHSPIARYGRPMKKQIVTTPKAPSSPLYSQAVKVGSTIYVSGTAGIEVATNQLAGLTIQEQTRQALRNCAAIVEAAGGRLEDVVQVTVLLANPGDFAGMNEEYAKVFAVDPPARAVAKLGVELPNLLVSIMMTAHVDD